MGLVNNGIAAGSVATHRRKCDCCCCGSARPATRAHNAGDDEGTYGGDDENDRDGVPWGGALGSSVGRSSDGTDHGRLFRGGWFLLIWRQVCWYGVILISIFLGSTFLVYQTHTYLQVSILINLWTMSIRMNGPHAKTALSHTFILMPVKARTICSSKIIFTYLLKLYF